MTLVIKTALSVTFPEQTGMPVCYLSDGCRRLSQRKQWEHLHGDVLPYHWDDRKKFAQDYAYLRDVYELSLGALAEALNSLHGTSHTVRYWRVVVGPWLNYFSGIVFDRWVMLGRAVEQYPTLYSKIVLLGENPRQDGIAEEKAQQEAKSAVKQQHGLSSFPAAELLLRPADFRAFNLLLSDDLWNELLYKDLIRGAFPQIITEECRLALESPQAVARNVPWKDGLRKVVPKLLKGINKSLQRDDAVFIYGSYLPLRDELQLQNLLGQVPLVRKGEIASSLSTAPCPQQAASFSLDFRHTADPFVQLLWQLIPRHIPAAYVEHYRLLQDAITAQAWPQQPRALFSSNAHVENDIFKAYAGEHCQRGARLVVGQHGGHYGTSPFSFAEEHEIAIADKWLSWGWSDTALPRVLPLGVLKNRGRVIQPKPEGKALLVEFSVPRFSYRLYGVPIARQWLDYFADQLAFSQALPQELQNELLVRLDRHDYGWDQRQRWQEELPHIAVDSGLRPLAELIAEARIYLATYNATTLLEPLMMNFPTLAFWNPQHWEIAPRAEASFAALREAGILHSSPQSAAEQLRQIWADIPGWWGKPEVQQARTLFCQQFAAEGDKLLERLATVLAS